MAWRILASEEICGFLPFRRVGRCKCSKILVTGMSWFSAQTSNKIHLNLGIMSDIVLVLVKAVIKEKASDYIA